MAAMNGDGGRLHTVFDEHARIKRSRWMDRTVGAIVVACLGFGGKAVAGYFANQKDGAVMAVEVAGLKDEVGRLRTAQDATTRAVNNIRVYLGIPETEDLGTHQLPPPRPRGK